MAHRQAETYGTIWAFKIEVIGLKVLKKLASISIILGYLLIIGSAGAEELDQISAAQCIMQTIAGIVLVGGGMAVYGI